MSAVADRYDAFVFDCDGVLYRDGTPIAGAAATLHRMVREGKQVYFVRSRGSPCMQPSWLVSHNYLMIRESSSEWH